VEGVCILPEWPGYARRIVAALEGVDRLAWGALREAFGVEEYDGTFGGGAAVDHLVKAGVVALVFWEVETGREVEGPDLLAFMVGMTADGKEGERWRAWAQRTAIGYRLAPHARPTRTT
jgi:hypothetical protein